ncbi:uncharacterized protein VTP21DRAFT_4155 [Calcarisporiella thermophila]|uniref:uncharacterized protein n=1 Tax=Calcarisporiella thermophila TaxID=911321 RepID=UPI003741EC6D
MYRNPSQPHYPEGHSHYMAAPQVLQPPVPTPNDDYTPMANDEFSMRHPLLKHGAPSPSSEPISPTYHEPHAPYPHPVVSPPPAVYNNPPAPPTEYSFRRAPTNYSEHLGYRQEPIRQGTFGSGNENGGGMEVNEKKSPKEPHIELQMPMMHYGTAPRHQPRRHRTVKRVQLTDGNLVLDCPVPSRYLDGVPLKNEKEFTHMRYTAATCDPNNFKSEGFSLRQPLMGRSTELFIVMTMYNEDEILFCRTMHGVMKNIAHLCTRDRSRTWGKDGWKKVVVCIVSDGRSKIHPRTLHVLSAMGVYQDGVAKNVVNGKPVTAHIYEFTTQISLDPELKKKGAEKGLVPVQVIFCLKEQNQKKINSHRWFFNGFGPIIQPNVCVLLDVGTRPGPTSIYHLWKAFDINSNVAGACGEIRAMTGTVGVNLINPLVAAQNFEYKMSNILDKPLESVFGYISVLPGAFSAYRYIALQNDPTTGAGPLNSYFKGEKQHGGDADVFTANMYLAEDRILCFELVAKKDDAWVLKYVASAYGETDVPDTVPEFVSQRRRWLNGSFFAAVYALFHFAQINRSRHSVLRKFLLYFEFIYQCYSLLFSWFGMGNFYLTFYSLAEALVHLDKQRPFSMNVALGFKMVLTYIYVTLLVVQFVMALGNRPQGSKYAYTMIMIFFAFIMGYMIFASIYITWVGVTVAVENAKGAGFTKALALLSNSTFRDIVISFAATYLMYIVSSLLYLDAWHMITSFIQYMFMMPSYINVLNIYAFCNTHDVSWGTKGDNTVATDLGVVKSSQENGVQTAEIAIPTEEKDLNADYDLAMTELQHKVEAPKQKRDAKTKQEDYYRGFRTRLVVAWILSNALLVVLVIHLMSAEFSPNAQSTPRYFAFVLWSVVALSVIRFTGSTLYLILRMITG